MKDRSCKSCNWKYKKESLKGTLYICKVDEKETKLEDYCPYFREEKTDID